MGFQFSKLVLVYPVPLPLNRDLVAFSTAKYCIFPSAPFEPRHQPHEVADASDYKSNVNCPIGSAGANRHIIGWKVTMSKVFEQRGEIVEG